MSFHKTDSNGHITFTSVEEYVEKLGGDKKKVIRKVLIANNGIAAVKAIKSLRKWANFTFGDESVIQFVVMATPEDISVSAEHTVMVRVNEMEHVPGGSNANNYANVDLIVEIAEKRQVQAVWAGWGHASENPALPEALAKTSSDIRFIGPGGAAMRALGDKIASTLIAQSANVNCVPWSGSGITLQYSKEGIPHDKFQAACVSSVEEAEKVIQKIGLPVMIKASEGGGGKGIRKVQDMKDLENAFRQVQGEVAGSPIFIMKMLSKCRHIEVQIIADMYGNAMSLYGRDCSVQRRHQKIIEEGPPIAVKPEVFTEMEQAAVRITKEVGYVGAGTIEYLYDEETASYYFLELNPRLQVEHTVTELITGVNLVAIQLNIAMGIPLDRIPDIRRLFGYDPSETTPIDFSEATRKPPIGHVIAARITGENPNEGFKPTSGKITDLRFYPPNNTFAYFSVGAKGGLHEYADSQFGHVFARGTNREEARLELITALKELEIRGEISTPVNFLIDLIRTEIFVRNKANTEWLDSIIASSIREQKPDTWLVVLCGALFKAHNLSTERYKKYISFLQRGQIPPKDLLRIEDKIDLIYDNVKYSFAVTRNGPSSFLVFLQKNPKGRHIVAELQLKSDGGLFILLNNKKYVCYGNETMSGLKLTLDGTTCIFTTEYDPTQLRSSTSGKLVRYLVEDGSHVKTGTPYAEMEVMKMYLPLLISEPGIIHFIQPEGSILQAGTIIAKLDLDDSTKVRRATLFEGELPDMKSPRVLPEKVNHQLREVVSSVQRMLQGYYFDETCVEDTVSELFSHLSNPKLPLHEFLEQISNTSAKLPRQLKKDIKAILDDYSKDLSNNVPVKFDGLKMQQIINSFIEKLSKQKALELKPVLEPLLELARNFKNGVEEYKARVITQIFKEYLNVERIYIGTRERALHELRSEIKDVEDLYKIELSHLRNLTNKKKLLLALMKKIDDVNAYSEILRDISELSGSDNSEVALYAKRMRIQQTLPTYKAKQIEIEDILASDSYESLVARPTAVSDVLCSFFFNEEKSVKIRERAAEIYVKRAYHAYDVKGFQIDWVNESDDKKRDDVLKADWFYDQNPQRNQESGSNSTTPSSLKRIETDVTNDLKSLNKQTLDEGIMVLFKSEQEMKERFGAIFEKFHTETSESHKPSGELNNVLKLCFPLNNSEIDEEQYISELGEWLRQYSDLLREAGTRRVTFVVTGSNYPRIYTYRERFDYQEDSIYRHIEPPQAFQMELRRLKNYNLSLVPTMERQIHLFYGEEKNNSGPTRHCCLFARSVIRGGNAYYTKDIKKMNEYLVTEAQNVLNESINAIELAMGESRYSNAWHNHIFISFIPSVQLDPEEVANKIIHSVAVRFEKRLAQIKIGEVEILAELKNQEMDHPMLIRFITTNPTRARFNTDAYYEINNKQKPGHKLLCSMFDGRAPLHNKELPSYCPPSKIDLKRAEAKNDNTTYCYDFIELFEEALKRIWISRKLKPPKTLLKETELILAEDGKLKEVGRPIGQNTIGMVAWKIRMFTPEYPEGRYVILVANDITFQKGSFGPLEDELFNLVSKEARSLGIPRVYLAANSGARIGLADEIKEIFDVEWIDENDPTKGFKSLTISDEDYQKLKDFVQATQISNSKWEITDIIGKENGLGVENLRGSGMIAGETSRAYEEIFTLTLVTGRTVGIGAYLVRLGQRTIQTKGPVILTGALALNKVLGRDVYTSNSQLGGTQIMFANGISHIIVNDDFEGVKSILNWLSYIPKKTGDPVPSIESSDPIERPIEFIPTKAPYDPRHMLAGYVNEANEWVSGFFDKDSFIETLAGWGKTVVCGRARLGGIPIGVIAVETRTVELTIPADPAVLESTENIVQQAGQVWFPDSSYKTAQAIKDFNFEELPLIIFANWRGFSGGLRDLYDEILKFGSYIVDNLRVYKQPIFIYLPPSGELRGGAWVVLDPTINPEKMEMYCDPQSSGGVLEPSGIVEIKFKNRDLIKTMHRMDKTLIELDKKLESEKLSSQESAAIKIQIQSRERKLLSVYQQIAIRFAELHDTPGRMRKKQVINDIIEWKTSRQFFYYRLKRRLEQDYWIRDILKMNPYLSNQEAVVSLKNLANQYNPNLWNNDKEMTEWMKIEKENIRLQLNKIRADFIQNEAAKLMKENSSATIDGISQIFATLSPKEKALLLKKLK